MGNFDLACVLGPSLTNPPEGGRLPGAWSGAAIHAICRLPECLNVGRAARGENQGWRPGEDFWQDSVLDQDSLRPEHFTPTPGTVMERGFRGPLQQQTPRTRPPYVDLVWPGMQWFLRPGRVRHPDKPDLVRMPDPGGGRFREWFSNFFAELSSNQIEHGKANGFWLTYDHRLAPQIDTDWKARLRPGPEDAWQRACPHCHL